MRSERSSPFHFTAVGILWDYKVSGRVLSQELKCLILAYSENVYGDKLSIMGEEKLEQHHKIQLYASTRPDSKCTNWVRVSFFYPVWSLVVYFKGAFFSAVLSELWEISTFDFLQTLYTHNSAQLNRWLLGFLWESGKDKHNQERLTQDKNHKTLKTKFFIWYIFTRDL